MGRPRKTEVKTIKPTKAQIEKAKLKDKENPTVKSRGRPKKQPVIETIDDIEGSKPKQPVYTFPMFGFPKDLSKSKNQRIFVYFDNMDISSDKAKVYTTVKEAAKYLQKALKKL